MALLKLIDRIAERVVRRVFSREGSPRQADYPYVVSLTGLIPEGCLFEISSEIEVYRVEKYGEERAFTALVLESLLPNGVLYDIGANVGLVTVHAAKRCAQVIAFEPDPDYCGRLKRNVHLNDLTNVQIVEWAVSDKPGEAFLFTDNPNGLPTSSPRLCDWSGHKMAKRVQTDTIDNALEREDLPWPSVMKIDVEGAEMAVLRGMLRLLGSETAPLIFIEIHPEFLPAFGSSPQEVMDFLAACGYRSLHRQERDDQIHYVFGKNY